MQNLHQLRTEPSTSNGDEIRESKLLLPLVSEATIYVNEICTVLWLTFRIIAVIAGEVCIDVFLFIVRRLEGRGLLFTELLDEHTYIQM